MRSGKRFFALKFVLSVTLLPAVAQADLRTTGNVTGFAPLTNGVALTLENGAAQILFYAPGIVRVRISSSGAFDDLPSGAVILAPASGNIATLTDNGDALFLGSTSLSLIVLKKPFRISAYDKDQQLLVEDANPPVIWDTANTVLQLSKNAPAGEAYFGLGMRSGPVNRRGRTFLMRNTGVAGYEELADPMSISIPFYYGVHDGRAYGLFLDNPASPFFDMDSEGAGAVTMGVQSGNLNYYLLGGSSMSDVAAAYASLTGPTPLPPKWTLGYQQSRYGYKSQDQITGIAGQFRSLQIPCDALYLDLDYMDSGNIFTWNPVTFPDPAGMNAQLAQQGFQVVNIVDAPVSVSDPLAAQMAASSFLLTGSDGSPYVSNSFPGVINWVDFTNPGLRAWYTQKMQTFLTSGTAAIWNDLNEPGDSFMVSEFFDFGGRRLPDLAGRNLYAFQQTSLSRESQLSLRPNVRPWVLSRSGYSGIQRFAANWSGDTTTSFQSLKASVEMSASMGISGQNQFGHDVGGFLGSPSPELFLRWLEFGAYTPLFRNHANSDTDPREPWAFGDPYTSIARHVIEGRYSLMPYLYSVMEDGERAGKPLITPTVFAFPSDVDSYTQNTEFMFGPEMLIAPVFEEGATTRSTYLPEGTQWIDRATDQVYAGGQTVSVDAPIDRIPVFVTAGAIIPTGAVAQSLSQNNSPDLSLDVYSGADGSFTLYEDDGSSFAYRNGQFTRLQLSVIGSGEGLQFLTRWNSGSIMPPSRNWNIRFHVYPVAPTTVQMSGVTLDPAASSDDLASLATNGWYYDSQAKILSVRLVSESVPTFTVE